MAKRFIDTEVWQSERFLDSNVNTKLLTIYLFTNCNYIGVFKKSLRLVSFEVGFTVTKQSVLECPIDIEILSDGSFWLSSFCFFQYGELKEACRPHKKYISELKKVGLFKSVSKGYQKGINTLEEQEQEQDKEEYKEQEVEKESEENDKNDKETPSGDDVCSQELFIEPIGKVDPVQSQREIDFEAFWIAYGRKGNKKRSKELFAKLTDLQMEEIRANLPAYLFSTQNNIRFRKDAQVYLNQKNEHWNDYVFIEESKVEPTTSLW